MSKRVHEKKVIKLTKEILAQRSEAGQLRRSVRLSGTKPRNDSNVWDGIAGKQFHAPRATDQRVKGHTVIKPVTLKRKTGEAVEVSRREYKKLRALAKKSRRNSIKARKVAK